MASYQPCWAGLPKELLSCIAKRLDTRLDVLHFRAVCNSWRSSVPVPPRSRLLPREVKFLINRPTNPLASFFVAQKTVYCIELTSESCSTRKCWFMKVEETKQDNKFRVLNPFSKYPIKNLPAASLPNELCHLNFRFVEMVRAFSIRRMEDDGSVDYNEDNPWIRKIKLASDFDSSYEIIAIKRGDLCHMRVNDDIHWHLLDPNVQYRDITNFEGKFFTADIYGVVLGLDENSFDLVEINPPLEKKVWEGERYFLESHGHLYMVVREFYCCPNEVQYDKRIDGFVKATGVKDFQVPVRFIVYKRIRNYHQSRHCWVEVNSLGDRVFFVSNDCSFSFSTRGCEGCPKNCIVYVDEIDEIERLDNGAIIEEDNDNGGLQQIRNGKVRFFNLEDGATGPLQLFPQLLAMFWPPPAWLRLSHCSSTSPHIEVILHMHNSLLLMFLQG
ncbi:hypothetical protein COLO4_09785 [Corchorus olitorius]|uniref:Uncharacterized protein n=1 Tax=Corchorus olitorius TaxID=93759 RepID=A0A1R3KB04_9ROSI|nr:hypothetical protein COLO4_09785 [Corchorus olitorius]